MLTDYIQIFCGSGIDALELKNRLNDISIYPIIKDESKSGNLAGFGIPNYMYSHKVFIHKDQFEDASLFIPEIIKQDNIQAKIIKLSKEASSASYTKEKIIITS